LGCQEGRNGELLLQHNVLSDDTNNSLEFQISMWHDTGHRAEVTCLVRSPQKDSVAVGYADGSIRLWGPSTGSVIAVFNGHKKSVTALAFDETGTKLASGSQDTDLIVWDIVAEAGILRYVILSLNL
jgi:U3 small nucleolar RNA-associated protein 12